MFSLCAPEFSPSQLVDKAVLVCKICLTPTEGDGADMPVQVCLAALELLSSIAALPPEVCSESGCHGDRWIWGRGELVFCTGLLIYISLGLKMFYTLKLLT